MCGGFFWDGDPMKFAIMFALLVLAVVFAAAFAVNWALYVLNDVQAYCEHLKIVRSYRKRRNWLAVLALACVALACMIYVCNWFVVVYEH